MANNMMNGNNRRPCPQAARPASSMHNDLHVMQTEQRNSNNGNSSDDVTCKDLMRAIMEADFMAQDLKLYLDVHPDDTRALELYREAVRQYKACKATFEDTFYPLTATSAGRNGTWDWLDGTFPPLS